MKLCKTCNTEKSLDDFAKKGNGRQSMCRACRKVWFAEHYKNNKQYYFANRRKQSAVQRKRFYEFKATLKCSRCDESHPACLDFHHEDPSHKDGAIAKFITTPRKLQQELAKCIVLCSNCHRKHHWEERRSEQI